MDEVDQEIASLEVTSEDCEKISGNEDSVSISMDVQAFLSRLLLMIGSFCIMCLLLF